jgi:hypothetical protein
MTPSPRGREISAASAGVRSSFRSTRRSYLTTSVLKQHSVMRLATGGSGGETVAVSHQTFHTCDALPWLPNRTLKVNPRNSLPLSEQHGGGGQVTCTRWWETPGHALNAFILHVTE